MRFRACSAAACLALLLAGLTSACAGDATASAAGPTLSSSAVFKEIDRLIDEQQLEAAAKKTAALLESAKKAGDAETQTRALVRATQLRISLGGYETAVEFLKGEPWPQDPQQRAILSLFYAHSLRTYQQAYWWEISQRERVVGDEVLDLKKWTARQIADAAIAAYADAYREREVLGGLSVEAWPEFIAANNYPRSVRGTLRDAVSYLFVELLGDTALWSPKHENDLYRLDLDALLADDSGLAQLDPADSSRHPIERAVGVVADLEAWHRGRREREGELEARLERARRLHAAFSQDADLRRIREDLAARLDRFAGLPWWAMGQATLADFVRGEDEPDALARARELALAGERAAPAKSPGALACRRIVAEIEAPVYQLTSMAGDAPGRRSIQVQHRNLPVIHLRAYRLDLEQRLRLRGRSLWPDWQESEALVARRPDAEWRAELPATPDYREHSTYVEPPLTAGVWVVVASARPDFVEGGNHRLMVPIVVGDLVLAAASAPSAPIEFRALSGATGAPVPSAAVTLYRYDWQSGAEQIAKGSTDDEGRVALQGSGHPYLPYFAVARHGGDVALIENVPGPGERLTQDDDETLVYTDRSIYRPQQTVQWKILAYRRKPGDPPRALPRTSVTVTFNDPNDEEVATQTVATNEYGTASGSFVVPGGRMLGSWSIETSLGGSAQVAVEEYKRPTFEVTLEDPDEALRLNRPASFAGRGPLLLRPAGFQRHGALAGNPAGSHSAVVALVGLERQGGRRRAGGRRRRGAARCRRPVQRRLHAPGRRASGGRGDRLTYLYEVHAEVSDEGGETREAERSFRLGFTSVEASIELPQGFVEAGRTLPRPSLAAVSTVPRGRKGSLAAGRAAPTGRAELAERRAGADAAGRETAIHDPGRPPAAAVGTRFRREQILSLWEDGREVGRGEVTHGPDGKATVALPALAPGPIACATRPTTSSAPGQGPERAGGRRRRSAAPGRDARAREELRQGRRDGARARPRRLAGPGLRGRALSRRPPDRRPPADRQ